MKKRFTLKNVAILVLLFVFFISFVKQEVAMKNLKKDIQVQQQELDKVREKNERLKEEEAQSKSEEYIEKMARERLGMVKPGEKSVINSIKK